MFTESQKQQSRAPFKMVKPYPGTYFKLSSVLIDKTRWKFESWDTGSDKKHNQGQTNPNFK